MIFRDDLGRSVMCLRTRARQHVSAAAEYNRRMIGLFRQARVIAFQRSNINESARPILSGFHLARADQSRQTALADRKERGSLARCEGEWLKRRRHSLPLDTRGPLATPRGLAPAAQYSGFQRWAIRRRTARHDPPGQGSDLPDAVVSHVLVMAALSVNR